jgi:hypothetical protein
VEIKTKFNINDEVLFLSPDGLKSSSGRITAINISVVGIEKRIPCKNDLGQTVAMAPSGEYEIASTLLSYMINEKLTRFESDLFLEENELEPLLTKSQDKLYEAQAKCFLNSFPFATKEEALKKQQEYFDEIERRENEIKNNRQ